MWTQVGPCWRKVNFFDNWENRTFNINEKTKAAFGHNTTELGVTNLIQTGGVGVTMAEESVQRSTESGKDSSGLGRWA